MQHIEQQIWQTLDSLYDAAFMPDKWQTAISNLMSLSDSITGQYLLFDMDTGLCPQSKIINMSEDFTEKYANEYSQFDPRFHHARKNPDNTLYYDNLYSPHHKKIMNDYHNWEKDQFGEYIYVYGAKLIKTDSHEAFLSFCRPERKGHLNEQEMDIFTRLIPHMRRALEMNQFLNQKSVSDNIHQAGFAQNGNAIIVLDQLGMPVFLNGTAERIIALQDAINIKKGIFRLIRHTDQQRFDFLKSRVRSFHERSRLAGDGEMIVPRKSGLRPYHLSVTPFNMSSAPTIIQVPSTLVIMRDPENDSHIERNILRNYFDLSRQESRVAALLVKGDNLKVIAQALGLKTDTIRTYLKHIYRKTGTKGQLELVRLLLKLK